MAAEASTGAGGSLSRFRAGNGLVLGIGYGSFSAIVWGGQFVVVKNTYAHIGPFEINGLRYVPIALIFVALLLRTEGRDALRLDGKGIQVFLLSVSVVLFNLLNYIGIRYTLAQNGALINSLTPLFVVLALWVARGIRPRRETALLVALALVGVAMVISHGHPGTYVDQPHWGDLLCMSGSVAFALYTLGMIEVGTFSALRVTTLTSIFGAVMMVAAAAVAAAIGYDPVPSWHQLWLGTPALLYLALPGAVIGLLAWNASARLIGGANTALLIILVPLTAFVIQIVRGYRPVLIEYVGAVIAMGAVTANNLLTRREAQRALVLAAEP